MNELVLGLLTLVGTVAITALAFMALGLAILMVYLTISLFKRD